MCKISARAYKFNCLKELWAYVEGKQRLFTLNVKLIDTRILNVYFLIRVYLLNISEQVCWYFSSCLESNMVDIEFISFSKSC